MGVFDVLSKVTGGGEAEESEAKADATDEVDAEKSAVADPDDLEPADFREGAEMLSGRSDVPELDFTEESLVDLDSIATGSHPVDDPIVYGSYLGETLVREFDGEWVRDDGWAVEIYLGDDSTTVAVFDAARMALERGPIFEKVAEQLHAQGDPYAAQADDAEEEVAGDGESESLGTDSEPESEPVGDGDDAAADSEPDDGDAADEPELDSEPEEQTPVDEQTDDGPAADPDDAPESPEDASDQAEETALVDPDAAEEPVAEKEPSSASNEEDEGSVEPSEEPVDATAPADTDAETEHPDSEPDTPQPSEPTGADTQAVEPTDEDDRSAIDDDGADPIESTDGQAEDDGAPAETAALEEGKAQADTAADEADESPTEVPTAEEKEEESGTDATNVDREPSSAAESADPEPSTSADESSEQPAYLDEAPARSVDDPDHDFDVSEPADRGDDPGSTDAVEEPSKPSEPSEAPESSAPPEPATTDGTDDVAPLPSHSDFEAAALRFTNNWPDHDFDYSPASLVRLDRFLDDQWEGRFRPGSLDDSSTDPTEHHSPLVNVGAYVGEILLRHYDGEWVRGDDGEPAIEVPGRHGRRETFPVFAATRRSLIHPARLAYEVDALAVRLDLDTRASGAEQTGFALGEGGPGTTASSADVITTILDRAEAFVERWPTYDFDYRPASLSRLDNLVARELDTEAYTDATLGDWTDPDALRLADTAAGIAAYYSAVLVRHLDAQWEIDDEVALAIDGPAGETREVPFDVAVARLRGRGQLMPSYDRVYDAVRVDSRTSE